MSRLGPIAGLGLLGLGVLAAVAGKNKATRSARPATHAMPLADYLELCTRWAGLWGLPPLVLEVIGTLESSRDPSKGNTSDPRAASHGGAWGLFGVTLTTARDLVSRIKPLREQPIVQAWKGTPLELLNPELNAAIASNYLGSLWKEFKAFEPTVAAYQQGPATVRQILARGGDVAKEIGPHGREYLARARDVRRELVAQGEPVA